MDGWTKRQASFAVTLASCSFFGCIPVLVLTPHPPPLWHVSFCPSFCRGRGRGKMEEGRKTGEGRDRILFVYSGHRQEGTEPHFAVSLRRLFVCLFAYALCILRSIQVHVHYPCLCHPSSSMVTTHPPQKKTHKKHKKGESTFSSGGVDNNKMSFDTQCHFCHF